jgi:hypothetical protein
MVKSTQERDAIPRGVWLRIARRKVLGDGVWHRIEGAVMSIDEAKIKHDAGIAEMCQTRDADYFYQNVFIRKNKTDARSFFSMRPSDGFYNIMGVRPNAR